ncbi:MAG: DUF2812 domain-containing protein [Solibacillus sp.]
MTKIVRKLRPTDYWRIGEHESWFSDMSAKGLHLHKVGIHFAHFKKGDPKRMEYRIEVTQTKEMPYEQSNMYEVNGWDYVASYQYFHVFSSPEENDALELHTDPMEQSYTLDQLNKQLILSFIPTAFAVLLIIGTLAAMWFLNDTPVLGLVEGQLTQQMAFSIIYLYLAYYSTRAMLSIQALRRKLKEGKAINHHAPWEKHLRRNTAFSIVLGITILIGSTLPLIQIFKSETLTLPADDSKLPIVRLGDIEGNSLLVQDEHYIEGIDYSNFYTFNWSLFAPMQYVTYENGVIENQTWLDKGGTYSPTIYTELYHLTLKPLAKPLNSDLIKRHSFGVDRELFVEIKHPNLDKLIIHDAGEMKQLIASKGKAVMYIRYSGNVEVNVIIENAAQKINLLSEE